MTGDEIHGLPSEDCGPPLHCIHPDPGQQCQEEAAWYAGGMTYTYSCHEHLIDRLKDVRYSITQIKRTPRWEPYT